MHNLLHHGIVSKVHHPIQILSVQDHIKWTKATELSAQSGYKTTKFVCHLINLAEY